MASPWRKMGQMLGIPNFNREVARVIEMLDRGVDALEGIASAAKGMSKSLAALAEVAREQNEMTADMYGHRSESLSRQHVSFSTVREEPRIVGQNRKG